MNVTLTIRLVLHFTWVYGGDHTFAYLILKPFCKWVDKGIQGTTVAGLFRTLLSGDSLIPAIMAIFVGCLVLMVFLAYRDLKGYSLDEGIDNDSKVTEKTAFSKTIWNIRLRILFLWMWIVFEIGAFYFSLGKV